MALFSKPAVMKFDGGDVVTVIGPEAYFNGVLTVRGSLRVEGEVEGNVNEAQTVIVGRSGRVRGDVAAEHVVVGGSVNGDVTASVQLELIAGGRIVGNIRTPKLLIEDGALFEGSCVMAGADENSETASAARAVNGRSDEPSREDESEEESEEAEAEAEKASSQ